MSSAGTTTAATRIIVMDTSSCISRRSDSKRSAL
jgi:hypothetical protein